MTKTQRVREHRVPVRWSPEAETDLGEIVTYLLMAETPYVARTVLARVRQGAEALRDFPKRGRVIPELQRIGINEWRELVLKPYRVIYTVEPDGVEIDAVLDSRRDVEALLHRRLLQDRDA